MDKDSKLRPLYLAQILYERTDEALSDHGSADGDPRKGIWHQGPPADDSCRYCCTALFWYGDPGSDVLSEAL